MSDHTITWTHGDGEGVDATVTCTAPVDANCRLTCPVGCEVWERTGHEHGYEVVPCLAVEWWAQHVNTVECGPTNSKGEPVRNGPIDIEWDGDDWLWEYADEPAASAVLDEVRAEVIRSNRKHGDQSHLPDGTGPDLILGDLPEYQSAARADHLANWAKARCKAASQNEGGDGTVTWEHILTEEFFEALAEEDPKALRAELVQVAAVVAKWVDAIDRRPTGAGL